MTKYIGVDVAKAHLDIDHHGKVIRIANEEAEINAWAKSLSKTEDYQVVCESTGGYEKRLTQQLKAISMPVFVAHPNKIRAFAKSKGLLAKTDKIDARLITEYAKTMQPKMKSVELRAEYEPIKALLKRRDQLIHDRTRELARLDKDVTQQTRAFIKAHIDFLNTQISSVEKAINEASQAESVKKDVDLLTSIPAIGKQTALMLLSFLPEIGVLEHKSVAALVGVAPFNRDSGDFRGKRFVQGGRAIVRKGLYMCAVVATRFNPKLSMFYKRLRAKGKSAKVALVAVINKLLGIIVSVYHRKTAWVAHDLKTS